MGHKKKLQQFEEIKTFSNVLEVAYAEVLNKVHPNKGKWRENVFGNCQPIVLELGCGKGEYTVGMSDTYPEKNFIGIDIKGARMWRGAKTAVEKNKFNAFFLRTRIEFISSFFDKDEIDEIWITFPDPQPQERRIRKRLTSPQFLKKYFELLRPGGQICLKTDSSFLYNYTLDVIKEMQLNINLASDNLYLNLASMALSQAEKDILSIPTHYEKMFIRKGHRIHFVRFSK